MIQASAALIFVSPLEGEVDSAKRWREGGLLPPSPKHSTCGYDTPFPDLWSDLPLKGGGDDFCRASYP